MRNNAAHPAPPRKPARGAALITKLAAGLIFGVLASGAGAAEDAVSPATRPVVVAPPVAKDSAGQIAKRFSELADPDATVRETARVELMGLKRRDLDALKRIVAESGPIVPAQAIALRDIVIHVYLADSAYSVTPDGFLGVRLPQGSFYVNFLNLRAAAAAPAFARERQFGDDPDVVSGIAILERMRGFAGARFLADGDVILGIEERPNVRLRDSLDLSTAVRNAGAGQTIHFQILRQGQVVRVPVTLDARPSLNNGEIDMDDLLRERVAASDAYWEREFAPIVEAEG